MALGKFRSLVHYIVARCDEPTKLGATRLNKILWFSDSIAYRLNGVPITGESYVKRQRGPVPKDILPALRDLEAEGVLTAREREHFGYKMRVFIALEDADASMFSEQELEIVNDVMDVICDHHTATSISDLSHDQIWDAANLGEDLPLYATLAASAGEVTPEIMEWGSSVVQKVESTKRPALDGVGNS